MAIDLVGNDPSLNGGLEPTTVDGQTTGLPAEPLPSDTPAAAAPPPSPSEPPPQENQPLAVTDQLADVLVADRLTATGLTAAQLLETNLSGVWAELASQAANTSAFVALLMEVYGRGSADPQAFTALATDLAGRIAAGDQLGLRYEIETDAEMNGASGAYAVVGDDGVRTIYVNGDWLATASSELARRVLLEEIGHSFDTELNGSTDTAGDEGELFANLFTGSTLSAEERAAIEGDNDQATLAIDGEMVLVEQSVTAITINSVTNASDPDNTDRVVGGAPTFTYTATTGGTGGNSITAFRSNDNGTSWTKITGVFSATSTWTDTAATSAGSYLYVFSNSSSGSNPTGNAGTGVVQANYSITIDTTSPGSTPQAATSTDGTKIILTYGEALSATTAAASQFAVTVGGATRNVTDVSVSGSTVVLTIDGNPIFNGQAATVAYNDPTANNDANAVQDVAGNDAASLSSTSINTNGSTVAAPDSTAPTISITASKSTLGVGDTAQITFVLSEPSTDFGEADVSVSGGSLSGWTASSSTVYTALFTPLNNSQTTATISVASNTFSNANGNFNTDGSDANNSVSLAVNTVAVTPGEIKLYEGTYPTWVDTGTTKGVTISVGGKTLPKPLTVNVNQGSNNLLATTYSYDTIAQSTPSGTGVFNTFLAASKNSQGFTFPNDPTGSTSTTVEQSAGASVGENSITEGFTTDKAKTSLLKSADIPTFALDGMGYRELRFDSNEPNNDVEPESLTELIIYQSSQQLTFQQLQNGGGDVHLVYDLDKGGDFSLGLLSPGAGSGRSDLALYIPDDAFQKNLTYTYVYFAVAGKNSGFDEWKYMANASESSLLARPGIAISKSATVLAADGGGSDGKFEFAGDKISYSVTLTNTGNVGLTGVTLNDVVEGGTTIPLALPTSGDLDNDLVLDTSEVWRFDYKYTLNAADISREAAKDASGNLLDGLLTNTASVSTNQEVGGSATAVVGLRQQPKQPSLAVTKSLTNNDDAIVDTAGETIEYTITIDNTGNVDLTGVTVGDTFAGGASYVSGDDGDNILETNETWTYSADYTVTQADLNSGADLVNVATVETDQTAQQQDDATSTVDQNPDFTFIKEVLSVTGGYNGQKIVDNAGDVINYGFTATNTGNITLTTVSVSDPLLGGNVAAVLNGAYNIGDSNQDGLFSIGEAWKFAGSYEVTAADISSGGTSETGNVKAGQIDNTATATATYGAAGSLELTDSKFVPVSLVKLDLTKEVRVGSGSWLDANTAAAAPVGTQWSTYQYRFLVKNEGGTSIALADLKLEDQLFGAGDIKSKLTLSGDANNDKVLSQGEVWTFTSSNLNYQQVGTQSEVDDEGIHFKGDVFTNTATAIAGGASDSDVANARVYNGPGVRTPGFWSNWTSIWNGNNSAADDAKFAGKAFFPETDILTGRAADGQVRVTSEDFAKRSGSKTSLVLGDWNGDGVINGGERGFSWTVASALKVVNASQKDQKDARYVLGRSVVASWLNHLNGSDVNQKDLQDGIDWLKRYGAVDGGIFTGSTISSSSAAWKDGGTYHGILDRFNNTGIDSTGTQISFHGG